MKAMIKISAVLAALSSTPAVAADLVSAAAPDVAPAVEAGWTYSITPYFWAAGLSSETPQLGTPAIAIDASFSDILDNLDFAAMLIGEARNGPYSLFGDLIYTKLGADSATPHGVLATTVDVEASTFAGL